MSSEVLQAGATTLVGVALAAYVGLRRERSALHWHLLALLATLLVWSAASIWRYTSIGPENARAAFELLWIGAAFLPAAWFLLAARYARLEAVEERRWPYVVVLLPSCVTYLLVITNDHHLLFYTEMTRYNPGHGPLFWVNVAWSYLLVIAGIALYLIVARRMMTRDAWGRGLLLAFAALVPVLFNAAYLFRWVDITHDPTPSAMGFSLLLMTVGIFRLHLLDTLPLAWRDVIEQLPDGVVIADESLRLVDANPAARRLLGASVAELRGRQLDQVAAPLGLEAVSIARSLDALADASGLLVGELTTPDGRCVETAAARVRGGDAAPTGWFVILRDRTDARRYERFVRQSQRLDSVGSLTAGIAHEVNNPLAFLRAGLGQLRDLGERVEANLDRFEAKDADALGELGAIVDECLDGIERIGRIVDGLRRFSRATSEEERSAVDVNAAVRQAIRFAELHENRSVTVEARLADPLPRVEASHERLVQVFLNLLLNAKHALSGRRDGVIAVETRCAGDRVEVVVEDNGPGIPEEFRDRVFDPFFTTKAPDEGTGLGLSIAFDIVRELGGVLELAPPSTNGQGACLVVHLAERGGVHSPAA